MAGGDVFTWRFLFGLLFAAQLVTYEIEAATKNPESAAKGCPRGYPTNPLILLSMDGFRADYIERGLTPTVESLMRSGVSTPYMKPSYPAITFPNHYTIVTGLLPPYHGIVANKFYDPEFNVTFRVGRKEFFQRRFWNGEAIWETVEKQGKKAAVYFWPGSETEGGVKPSYYFLYNESHPFESRVEKVFEWLDLPLDERPDLINLYLHEPDRSGHNHGPDSYQVNKSLIKVNKIVKLLIKGLKKRKLFSCVNMIILADHGMAEAGEERVIYLQEYIPDINETTLFWDGVFPRFERQDQSPEKTQEMMEELSCERSEMRIYSKTEAPMRWHLGGQRRIEDVVLDMDAGYQIDFDGTYEPDKGDHGYDNIFHSMNALFLAHGPSFRKRVEVESFQNIEVYNLMCALIGLKPAPNNGTWGSLHHLLKNPPPIHDQTKSKEEPNVAKMPVAEAHSRIVDSCESLEQVKDYQLSYLNTSHDENLLFRRFVLPWGIPRYEKTHTGLLFHPDHIAGYSKELSSPVWIAFNVDHFYDKSKSFGWVDDPRIPKEFLRDVCDTDTIQHLGYAWEPLFHPDFSSDEMTPSLVTNSVPLTSFLQQKWHDLRSLIKIWSNFMGTRINVVLGPIYDYDGDTFADKMADIKKIDKTAVPSHLFAVLMRCLGGEDVVNCPPKRLDINSFIFPQSLSVDNCMNFLDFAREFSAKLSDVEKASGVHFLPELSPEDRIRLQIRFHSNIWGMESWKNRLSSSTFGLKRR